MYKHIAFNSFNYFPISTNNASQITLSGKYTTKPKARKIHCHVLMGLFSAKMKILNLRDGMSLIHCFLISLTMLEMGTEGKLHRDTTA